MPGAYAHITAVNSAAERMGIHTDIPVPAKIAVGTWAGFCELGAVSPDYPCLHIAGGANSEAWADAMHPVVDIKVGSYEANKAAHRSCEMNQDSHIFHTRMNLAVRYADHLRHGVLRCCDPADPERLDPDAARLWADMLRHADRELFLSDPPDIDAWHDWFEDGVSMAGARLVALARHVSPSAVGSFAYPFLADADPQYLVGLETPDGARLHYAQLFDRAVAGVLRAWAAVTRDALTGSQTTRPLLRNVNRDTGEDEAGALAFWS